MIEGWFERRSGYFNPKVRVTLWVPQIVPQPAIVEFIIDTGADLPSLHPLDAVSVLGIPLERLQDENGWNWVGEVDGIGGKAKCYVEPATFSFRHTDGREEEIQTKIFIMKHTEHSKDLPSILGWDVLRHFELRINWHRDSVTLLSPFDKT